MCVGTQWKSNFAAPLLAVGVYGVGQLGAQVFRSPPGVAAPGQPA